MVAVAGAAVRLLRPGRGERVEPARRGPADPDRRGDRPAVRAVPRRARGPDADEDRDDSDRREPDAADELVALLDLEYLDVDLFRGRQPDSTRQRVYGGQVAAQALIAGARTRRRDGASTCTRCTPTSCCPATTRCRSSTTSSGSATAARSPPAGSWPASTAAPIYYQTLSFQRGEEGFEHQDVMPEVKGPDEGLDLVDLMRGRGNEDADALGKEWAALDVRWLGNSPHGLEPTRHTPRGPRCGSGSAARCPTTRSTTSRPSPTPATSRCSAPPWPPTSANPTNGADGLPRPHRSGSTGRSAPTSGGSTTSGRPRPAAPAAFPSAGSSPRTAPSSPRSPRRA